MQLHYQAYGEAGPPLIILHGLLGSGGNWHTLSRSVFGEHFRVYAVDQRNHGRSPHTERLDYEAMAEDLEAFMDQQDLSAAHLLGHSMGGKTAMWAALQHPDRVDRLVVVDMAPKAYPPHHKPLLEALRAIDPGAYESRQAIDQALAERVPARPVRQFLLKNLAYDSSSGVYSWQMNLEAIARNYDRLNAALETDRVFEGPARFIRGERSDYVADEDLPAIHKNFPRAELETIPGAGHWVHADRPEAFAEVVMAFLKTRVG